MNQGRVDTIDRLYRLVQILEYVNGALFWISVMISFAILFLDAYPSVKSVVNIMFVVITITYFLGSLSLSLFLLPRAQISRSTNMISNALGVTLDNEETQNYYNNTQNPSLIRLGMIIFENSLFSTRVISKMLVIQRIKIFCYLLIWILLLLYRDSSLELITVVAQTLFTSNIISNYLRLEMARAQFQRIYAESWNLFLRKSDQIDDITTGLILDLAIKYESVKASMTVVLSSKIFHKINAETTLEWENIKNKLSIS